MSVESNETEKVISASKSELVKIFARKEKDTGSPEVQVALLTKRIQELTGHFAKHKEDRGSQRGLLALISQRKRLLQYLKETDIGRYRQTIETLGLRK